MAPDTTSTSGDQVADGPGDQAAAQSGARARDRRADEVTYAPLDPADRDVAVASLARAFWPDPLFGFFAPDPIWEHRNLPVFFRAFFDDAVAHGETWTARATGRCIGSASWLPPGAMPRGARRDAGMYRSSGFALLTARNRVKAIKLLNEVDRRHPHQEHWYLVLLGVDPGFQHRGIGGRLMAPVLERCDREGLPAYLETQKPENVAFYARHGFGVRDEVRLPGCPPVWLLWREPKPGRV